MGRTGQFSDHLLRGEIKICEPDKICNILTGHARVGNFDWDRSQTGEFERKAFFETGRD